MSDTGWVIAGSGANYNDGGNTAWSNPGNVTASDDTRANSNVGSFKSTQRCEGYNFGLSVPTGAEIDGIEARVEGYASAGSKTIEVGLFKTSTTQKGSTKSGTWVTTEANQDFGGAADLWSTTFTAAEVNASDFIIGVNGPTASANYFIDAIYIKVHYTSIQDVSPDAVYTSPNTVHSPAVVGPQELTPSLFTNTNTISNTHLVGQDSRVQVSWAELRGVTGAAISGSDLVMNNVHTSTNTFYTHVLSNLNDISPDAIHTSSGSIYTPTVTTLYALTVDLLTNTNTYYTHVLTPGAVDVSPDAIHTSAGEIFTPTVTSLYALVASLHSSANTYYTHVLTPGALDISPDAVHTSTNTYYTPVVFSGITLTQDSTHISSNTYPTALLTTLNNLQPSLHTSTNTFYQQLLILQELRRVAALLYY